MFMHERLHSASWPTKILYHVGNKEALLGWRTSNFDLYIVFDPLISKAQAITSGNKLIKWIIVSFSNSVCVVGILFPTDLMCVCVCMRVGEVCVPCLHGSLVLPLVSNSS